MKTTRKNTENVTSMIVIQYQDFPKSDIKTARISEWENGEGCDVYLGSDKVELTHQEIAVLSALFAQIRIIV